MNFLKVSKKGPFFGFEGSIFRGWENFLKIGQSPKFWGNFSKSSNKIILNFEKTMGTNLIKKAKLFARYVKANTFSLYTEAMKGVRGRTPK